MVGLEGEISVMMSIMMSKMNWVDEIAIFVDYCCNGTVIEIFSNNIWRKMCGKKCLLLETKYWYIDCVMQFEGKKKATMLQYP